METVEQQLTVIDRSLEVFKGGSAILVSHQNRSLKAFKVAENILQQWNEAYAIENEDQRMEALGIVDKRSNDFLANCGKAKVEMEEARKAITQLMDEIKKMFTQEEAKIDPKKSEPQLRIQGKRDQYAKDVLETQERKRKEAEARAAKAKEEVEIRSYIKNTIAQKLIDYTANKKQAVTKTFNAITLDVYEAKAANLKSMVCTFPVSVLDEILIKMPVYHRHTPQDVDALREQERDAYNFDSFYKLYHQQLNELKQSLIDRLPAKKQELEEQKRLADEAEARKQEEKRKQEEAERRRQEDLAKSKNEAERKLKEEEADRQRKEEADRLAAMEKEAEEKRLAAEVEQKRREKEEADRLAAEAAAEKRKAEEESELQKAAGTALAMFTEVEETAVNGPAPETRSGFDIKILNPAGWVEIFTFWFQREGVGMSVDDIGGKKLEQMKKFAEKIANKTGEKIDSKNLRYETEVKSVNRRAK